MEGFMDRDYDTYSRRHEDKDLPLSDLVLSITDFRSSTCSMFFANRTNLGAREAANDRQNWQTCSRTHNPASCHFAIFHFPCVVRAYSNWCALCCLNTIFFALFIRGKDALMAYGGLQQHVVHADIWRFTCEHFRVSIIGQRATLGGTYHALWLGIVALWNGLDLKLSTHQVVGTLVRFCKVVCRQPFLHKRPCQPVLLCLLQSCYSHNAFNALIFKQCIHDLFCPRLRHISTYNVHSMTPLDAVLS